MSTISRSQNDSGHVKNGQGNMRGTGRLILSDGRRLKCILNTNCVGDVVPFLINKSALIYLKGRLRNEYKHYRT